jgi:hypothetical protein
MILNFPTGSSSDPPSGEALGFITFADNGTWSFLPGKLDMDIENPSVKKMIDAVDFFAFSLTQQDFVERFLDSQKNKHKNLYDEWRKRNIKLVEDKE